MCGRYQDTDEVRYIPGELQGSAREVHVLEVDGDYAKVCGIVYPYTGNTYRVPLERIYDTHRDCRVWGRY